jgi:hypothetical protein
MSLVGNYGQEHYGFQQRGFTTSGALVPVQGDFRSVTFGATLVLPVRNRNQGGLAAAEAERNGAEQALAARQLVAQAEIDAATLRAREARRAVDLYATNVRELARQNVEVELEAFDLGRTPLTDLLAEQRRYLDVEAGYTSVLARAYDAQVTLRTARDETRCSSQCSPRRVWRCSPAAGSRPLATGSPHQPKLEVHIPKPYRLRCLSTITRACPTHQRTRNPGTTRSPLPRR